MDMGVYNLAVAWRHTTAFILACCVFICLSVFSAPCDLVEEKFYFDKGYNYSPSIESESFEPHSASVKIISVLVPHTTSLAVPLTAGFCKKKKKKGSGSLVFPLLL